MGNIDLNCDLGESFGDKKIGKDNELFPLISSANIACGFHGGDPNVMLESIETALEHDVAIGAHPSYYDLEGFGRRSIKLTPTEIYNQVIYQLGAIEGFCRIAGANLQHVKPHGALYNDAAEQTEISEAITRAIVDFDDSLLLYGLAESQLISTAKSLGIRTVAEGFLDRRYSPNGTLVSRSESDALIADPKEATSQALSICENGKVISQNGEAISVNARTLCIHGDGESAVEIATLVNQAFEERGIKIEAPK